MLKEYIKIALRNIRRHKRYTFVNILGLTAGMFCVSLYMLLCLFEFSFDSFHNDADQIYMVYIEDHSEEKAKNIFLTPYPLRIALREKFQEIKYTSCLYSTNHLVQSNNKSYYEIRTCHVDPYFFKIFNFPILKGNPENLLPYSNSVVITDETAKKYFGNQNPVGKTLYLDNQLETVVSGVIHIPKNSYFIDIGFFFTQKLSKLMDLKFKQARFDWELKSCHTFIKFKANFSAERVEQKFSKLLSHYVPGTKQIFKIQKFKHIHLKFPLRKFVIAYNNIILYTIIAGFTLLVACFNFISLSTTQIEQRFREFKLRKLSGAKRKQLAFQFLTESFLYTMMSFFLVLLLLELLLPYFNKIWQRQISINFLNVDTLFGFLGVILLTEIIISFYPIIIISVFKTFPGNRKKKTSFYQYFRIKALMIICQFTITSLLIIGSLLNYSQVQFCYNKNIGFDHNNLIWKAYKIENLQSLNCYTATKNALLKNPKILSVTSSFDLPFLSVYFNFKANWQEKKPKQDINFGIWEVDEDFIPTLNLQIIEGRNFYPNNPSDKYNVILNEEAVRQMRIEKPIGKEFETLPGKKGKIIGIIKDFHTQPMRQHIKPIVLCLNFLGRGVIIIRIIKDDPSRQVKFILQTMKQYNPNYSLEYNFLSDTYKSLYEDEQRFGKLLTFFSMITVIISCLGVFALSYFTVEKRTKEIGIRKAVGSSMQQIVWLISKDFLKWVFISTLIAWPIAYIIVRRWLNQYAYHTPLTIWPFLIATAITLLITLITVSFHAIQAGNANPVDALRDE